MPPQSGAAAVFVERDYGGASAILDAGDYNLAQSPAGSVHNDTISSLQVATGYAVTVYTDTDFSGDAATFRTDTPWVGGRAQRHDLLDPSRR